MKKLFLFILVSIRLTGFTQVDNISNNISQQNSNLGIRTSSPLSPLEVIGNGTQNDDISINNNNYLMW